MQMAEFKVESAPSEVLNLIELYEGIRIGNKTVVCPYFRNVKRVRAELRSLIGKGTPEEIGEEVLIYSKLRGFDIANSSEDDIREFMKTQGIGIDCSGFVSHVLDTWVQALGKGRLWNKIKFEKSSIYRSLIRLLRPIENISADLLTSDLNTKKVKLKKVKPGDLLRLKGLQRGDHVAIVIQVIHDIEGKLLSFWYAESSENYKEDGVRVSEVRVTNENGELKDQDWLGIDDNGVCWTLRQLEKDYEDNGLRRPLFL